MSEEYKKTNSETTNDGEHTNSSTPGVEILTDLPDDFDDFRAQQDAPAKVEVPKDDSIKVSREHVRDNEHEKSINERQVEDLEVLLTFCDIDDTLSILKSDDYGKLLKSDISIVDLFNANALFSRDYYGDGFPNDETEDVFYYRYNNGAFYDERSDEPSTNVEHFKSADVERAEEVEETLDFIVQAYLSEDSDPESTQKYIDAVKTRAANEELSDEQKDFLRSEYSIETDRLLYNGRRIDEDRAYDIFNAISDSVEDMEYSYEYDKSETLEQAESSKENLKKNLLMRSLYAGASVEEYEQAGRDDLIYGVKNRLTDLVNERFEDIIDTKSDWASGSGFSKADLILEYSYPYTLIERAQRYNEQSKESRSHDEQYDFIHPNQVIERIRNATDSGGDTYLTYHIEDLRALGASDEAILAGCKPKYRENLFAPMDFSYNRSGSRLVESGINRKDIIANTFSSWGHSIDPFEKQSQGYPYNGKSFVEILEDNGFDITDIAQTFSPDAITNNLQEFLDRGADAKELTKYMMSYQETFEDNLLRHPDGSTEDNLVWRDGIQPMIVWDKNHPEGRKVTKEGMKNSSTELVADNLNILAEHGVTEEDIIDEAPGSAFLPYGDFMAKFVTCPKFDTDKVLKLGFQQYLNSLERSQRAGHADPEFVKSESDFSKYIIKIFNRVRSQLNNS